MITGLVLRLALATIDGFGVDMGTFQSWSVRLANDGPWNFYKDDFFTDYAPGYMYVLWFIGEVHQVVTFSNPQFEYALKLPSIAADLASAWLLYLMLKQERPWVRLGAVTLYLFLPITLLIGALWGQVDSILAFFLLLSVYYIGRDRPVAGAVAYTIGFLTKPQAIAALPFLAFWILRRHPIHFQRADGSPGLQVPEVLVQCTVIPLLVVLVLITPFFKLEPWRLIGELQDATQTCNYRVNSFWAYNFWTTGGLFDWGFRPDTRDVCDPSLADQSTSFLGLATMWWGRLMFFASIALIIAALRNARGTGFLALGTALSMLAFYLFLTRMHERYAFPAFLPLLAACVLIQSRMLWGAFAVAATAHFMNLYHVFGYYGFYSEQDRGKYPDFLRVDWLYEWLQKDDSLGFSVPLLGTLETVQVLAICFVAAFATLLSTAYLLGERRRLEAAAAE